MAKKKNEISIRSSVAEYLTYVASVGSRKIASKCVMRTKIYG